jgi:hypothetical protein
MKLILAMITRCNCIYQRMLWLIIKNDLEIIPLIFYLAMLMPWKEYSEWSMISYYLPFIYFYLLTYSYCE